MIQYTNGYKYRLHTDATFQLPADFAGYEFHAKWGKLKDCKLELFEGYASDGPSGLTFDTKNAMRGAFGHDGLYQAIREGLLPRSLKVAADNFLRDQCIEDGMTRIRASLWHRAVIKFGLSSTIRNKDILCAP